MPRRDLPDLLDTRLLDSLLVKPGAKVRLRDRETSCADSPEFKSLRKDVLKDRARRFLQHNIDRLADAQELLWASDTHAVLIILQALDAAGKDGVIKHVMSGVNPQGCQVHAFKRPSPEELDHTFLWRCSRALPERGRIGIFNRSYYEDVLVVRVHPELLDHAQLPSGKRGRRFWTDRYDDINNLEHHLSRNGTLVLKFFLHLSKDEQRSRLLERLREPDKRWKFSLADVAERACWDDYQDAYEDMLQHTSTEWAPWRIVPADNKWVTRALIAEVLTSSIHSLNLKYPMPGPAERRLFGHARRQLARE